MMERHWHQKQKCQYHYAKIPYDIMSFSDCLAWKGMLHNRSGSGWLYREKSFEPISGKQQQLINYPIKSYFQYYHKFNIIETNAGRNFAKIATKMKLAHFPMVLVANYLRKIWWALWIILFTPCTRFLSYTTNSGNGESLISWYKKYNWHRSPPAKNCQKGKHT